MPLGHVFYGDEQLPITHFFDDEGDAVQTWDEAATFVAGPLSDGTWLSGVIAEFEPLVTN